MIKTCTKCQVRKPSSEFYVRDRKTGRRWAHCKKCFRQYQKQWANRPGHKERISKRVRSSSAENRLFIQSFKKVPCSDCGGSFPPCAMDFDHREPKLKKFQVSNGIRKSQEAIRAEIKKCDVVCANCHRIRTWTRRQY